MMTVRTKLEMSAIHGIGLFADEDIPAGTVVWRYNPLVDITLTQADVDSLHPACREQILHYSFKTVDGRYVLVADNNRFINFSKLPNVTDVADIESPSVAARDIKCGEELTTDYCFDFDRHERNME